MPQDEFAETPYAASFGPVPGKYQETPDPLDVSSLQQSAEPTEPPSEDYAPAAEPVRQAARAIPLQVTKSYASRRNNKAHALPSLEAIVMDENMAQSLAAAEQLSTIGLDDSEQWDATIDTVIGGLRSLQTKWSTLEAERKKLTRPINAASQSSMTRGVRKRGRGRGRRRGRWRAT